MKDSLAKLLENPPRLRKAVVRGSTQVSGDTSAYVNDWAVGPTFTNDAFAVAVAEPASLQLMVLGVLAGAVLFRRR